MPRRWREGGLGDAAVVHVAACGNHSMALTAMGDLWTWGTGYSGELGHRDEENSSVPREVNGMGVVTGMSGGEVHSLATTATGSVRSFGRISDLWRKNMKI